MVGSAASLIVATLQLRLALRAPFWLPRSLFAVSGLALITGMTLAGVYSFGQYWGLHWLEIPDMLRFHGAVNALGFAIPGLLAWISWAANDLDRSRTQTSLAWFSS